MKWLKFGVSEHWLENAWRAWPNILHCDASWPLWELIRVWQHSVEFSPFGTTLTYWNGSNWGFQAFPGKCIEGMAYNFACWCILTTCRTNYIMVMVCWFYKFWRYFDLVKWVKFGYSGHFLEAAWKEWPDVCWCMLMYPDHHQNWLDYGHSLWIFFFLVPLSLSETGQFEFYKYFLENT